MSGQSDVTVELMGYSPAERLADFVARARERGWRPTQPSGVTTGGVRGPFIVVVRVPERELDDLRAMVWDYRRDLPRDCYINSAVRAEDITADHRAAEAASEQRRMPAAALLAEQDQQEEWKSESAHLMMDL
jgi:hypothetical protein